MSTKSSAQKELINMSIINIGLNCTGCSACASTCPKDCIKMAINAEGYEVPYINTNLCIDCRLCERVCPVINNAKIVAYSKFYIQRNNKEEELESSSSGGIFIMLAKQIIKKGGVVFGAKFDANWNVVHDYIETEDGLKAYQGSKYVQSRIGNNYRKVKSFLEDGRHVLFTGTPCQIAGLKLFIGKDFPKLITVDVICHGVPSPTVFHRYLNEEKKRFPPDSTIEAISFRDKTNGWRYYNFCIKYSNTNKKGAKECLTSYESIEKNSYMKGFINNLFLRKSCSHCLFKGFSSGSDITLGDAWGIWDINNKWNDDKGCSLIAIHTAKGNQLFQKLDFSKPHIKIDEHFIRYYNSVAYESAKPHKNRARFFRLLNSSCSYTFDEIIQMCLPPPTYLDKVLWSINKRIKKICQI